MKKTLSEKGSEVRILEDIAQPHVKFEYKMKDDNRLNPVFTRDGVIHYIRNDDNRRYIIHDLYTVALDFDYGLQDLHYYLRC